MKFFKKYTQAAEFESKRSDPLETIKLTSKRPIFKIKMKVPYIIIRRFECNQNALLS